MEIKDCDACNDVVDKRYAISDTDKNMISSIQAK